MATTLANSLTARLAVKAAPPARLLRSAAASRAWRPPEVRMDSLKASAARLAFQQDWPGRMHHGSGAASGAGAARTLLAMMAMVARVNFMSESR
ncbi:hypothetical protein G7Z17_g11948 [Cylindrodendrum hubeiense]|uniref:Uncharacterized protein n=1 Tax=Cylindrodendrum hubeiense TaxID=595255 RepID=A0A9P5LB44_9HYPO|nr:hypothetical protein G7Z17_g11948 [Cylindrodendrum hubeiense]